MYGLILKRKNLDLNTTHPTVLIVYGGPGEQVGAFEIHSLRYSELASHRSTFHITFVDAKIRPIISLPFVKTISSI